jgi:2'-5' RNA ligase
MSERLLRTFISVTLPREIVNLSKMLQTTVTSKKDNVKWVNPGNIHLTLKFLGYTPKDITNDINKVISKIVSTYSSIELNINGTGCFPNSDRPRILWLGVDGELKPFQKLVKDLNSELEKMDFPIEEKDFIPHITLARVKYPPKETPDINKFLNTKYNPINFNISRVRYLSSELFPNGPIYSILGTHFLGDNPK